MSLMRRVQVLASSGFKGRAKDWYERILDPMGVENYPYKSVWNTLQALAARGEVTRKGKGQETIYG